MSMGVLAPFEAEAKALDAADPLASFRSRFHNRPGVIYLDGNSLGLLSRDAEAAVQRVLDLWRTEAIDGYSLPREESWFYSGEELGARLAPLVGAEPDEVVVTGTTIVNLHALLATFFRPAGRRRKLLATALDFPSDIHALQSQLLLHDLDPDADLVRVPSRDGRTIAEEDIIAALTDEVAVAVLPGVLYRSGQLLDMERLTAACHERGILAGFDCSHSVGAVPHALSAWGVDFGVWCSYKYLNAGPGAVAALYINRRHHARLPGLWGWWGHDKNTQFDMAHTFTPAAGAGAWQISSNAQLAVAPLRASLGLFHEAGLDRLRAKSLAQTDFLIRLLDALAGPPWHFTVGTPREHARRGGHVALEHPTEAARICKVLKRTFRVIPDLRPPDVIRLAPIPLYTTFHEVWTAATYLERIVTERLYEQVEPGRELIA
jgi:kynureninase